LKKILLLLVLALLASLALGTPQVSAASNDLTSHGPIYIDGDEDFTSANGVVAGSGTESDPYMIKNWVIDASGNRGIWIKDTTKYFIIRNCVIENGEASYGIYLANVRNGRIEEVTCNGNYAGIVLKDSDNNNLSNNVCTNNGQPYGGWPARGGIYMLDSNYNTLLNNICENNAIYGIGMWRSKNNILSNNTCKNNSGGIYLEQDSHRNTLQNNLCENNTRYGIHMWNADHNTLSTNVLKNNGSDGVYLAGDCDHNFLSN